MQKFTKFQKRDLLANSNVVKITESHVVFTPEFKRMAVELYLSGVSPIEVFQSNGIDPSFFIPDFCRNCIKRWVIKFETEGSKAFTIDNRGSGTPTKPVTNKLDSYSMDDLKAIIIVQEEMIEELKKKKALAGKMKSN